MKLGLNHNTACIIASILGLAATANAATHYVSTTGTGACGSWAQACPLATALGVAANGDQIWVKAGTYLGPVDLPNGVKIIGGFAGTETAASQSNPATNVTIIDGQSTGRAVTSTDDAASTILRGFTIKNGNDTSMDGGGGLLAENSGAVFVNCTFQNNVADYFGGAVMIKGSGSPQFANCKFFNNGTGSGTSTKPLGGGVVFLHSGTPTFTNCLFYNNKAGEGGVIIANDGTAMMVNCTIRGNSAQIGDGGAINDPAGKVRLRNTIVWGNTVPANRSGPQFFNNSAKYPASVTYSDVQAGFDGAGNINSDPLFVKPNQGDFKLQETSPCINVGSNSALPADVGDLDWDGNTTESLPLDLAGLARKVNFTVDMGAYEVPGPPPEQ